MARKKKNLLKQIVGNNAIQGAVSNLFNTGVKALPSPETQAVARILGSVAGSAISGRRKKKRRGQESKGSSVVSVAPRAVQYTNAPTDFGVTITSNSFSTRQIDKETIECCGKVDLPYNIGMFADGSVNGGAMAKPSDILAQSKFIFNPLNVASNDVNSRLGKMAQTYTKHAWRQMEVEYIPCTSTQNPGQFDMAICWDPTQSIPAEAKDLLNYDDSVETSAWKPTKLPITCPAPGLKETWCFNQLSQSDDATTKLNFACQIQAMLSQLGTTAAPDFCVWGSLCLHYKVLLFKPTLDDNEVEMLMSSASKIGYLSTTAFKLLIDMLQFEGNRRSKEISEPSEGQLWKRMKSGFPCIVTLDELSDKGLEPIFAFRSCKNSRRIECLGRILESKDSSNDAVVRAEFPEGIPLYQLKSQDSCPEGNSGVNASILSLKLQLAAIQEQMANMKNSTSGVVTPKRSSVY